MIVNSVFVPIKRGSEESWILYSRESSVDNPLDTTSESDMKEAGLELRKKIPSITHVGVTSHSGHVELVNKYIKL